MRTSTIAQLRTIFSAPDINKDLAQDRLSDFTLGELVFTALETTDAFKASRINTTGEFSDFTYAELLLLKEHLQSSLDAALLAYRGQVKAMAKAFSRVYALQSSKQPNPRLIAEAAEFAAREHASLAPLLLVLRDAQSAEEYFRSVPNAYKSRSTDDLLWVVSSTLRTAVGAENPKADNLESLVVAFTNELSE